MFAYTLTLCIAYGRAMFASIWNTFGAAFHNVGNGLDRSSVQVKGFVLFATQIYISIIFDKKTATSAKADVAV